MIRHVKLKGIGKTRGFLLTCFKRQCIKNGYIEVFKYSFFETKYSGGLKTTCSMIVVFGLEYSLGIYSHICNIHIYIFINYQSQLFYLWLSLMFQCHQDLGWSLRLRREICGTAKDKPGEI